MEKFLLFFISISLLLGNKSVAQKQQNKVYKTFIAADSVIILSYKVTYTPIRNNR